MIERLIAGCTQLMGDGSNLSHKQNQMISMNFLLEKSVTNTKTAQQVRSVVRKPVRNPLKELAR